MRPCIVACLCFRFRAHENEIGAGSIFFFFFFSLASFMSRDGVMVHLFLFIYIRMRWGSKCIIRSQLRAKFKKSFRLVWSFALNACEPYIFSMHPFQHI
jgi:hypothetical protein